jgi:AcrR family transcriptional regulator
MAQDLGLRERKKREQRRQLAEVALRLFAERGFEAVTVADIAAAAGVSDKTVFNYFATKEDLVFDRREELESELVRAVCERAPGTSALEAVRRHAHTVAERMGALPAERRSAFRKVVQGSPALHARMRQLSLRSEEELAQVLAEETGAAASDPTPRVVASTLGMLARLGFGVAGWPEAKRRSHAETLAGIDAAFDAFAHGLADYGVRKGR